MGVEPASTLPACTAIERMLSDRGTTLDAEPLDARLWEIGDSTLDSRVRRPLEAAGLPPSGLHVMHHTAAKLRRDAGELVEAVSSFL